MAEPTTAKHSSRRRLSMLMLALHGLAGIAWLAVMPHAFAVAHPRFWLNTIFPIIVLLSIAASIRWRALAFVFPAMWFMSAITGIIEFPHDFRIASLAFFAAAIGIFWTLDSPLASSRPLARIALVIGGTIGAIAPLLIKPGMPRTIPSDVALAPTEHNAPAFVPFQPLSPSVGVSPNTGHISLDIDRVRVDIAPLLTFTSRSIDGAPVVFTSRATRTGPPRAFVGLNRPTRHSIDLAYVDDGEAQLRINASDEDAFSVEAMSRIPQPIYSHLNAFTEIDLIGHRRLQLGFSPCGEARFDVVYSEYPRGKPARFAYLDVASSRFKVVQATSAEKGPFTTLGEGPLRRGEPLTITLYDDGRVIGSITFDDWSAQASDEISPTAGWNVPANAIEFSLYYEGPTSVAGIWLTLASTSVGRGWDTVGHAAGTYRNRMTIRRIDQ